MHSFETIIKTIGYSYTAKAMKGWIRGLRMQHPARVTDMYLSGEHPSYIAQACLVVMQVGE